MQYKALVFDFFGVVCSEISPFWFEEHFAEKGEELRRQYLRPADRGDISQEDLFRQLSMTAGVPAAEIEKDWEAHIRFNTELITFIKEIRTRYKTGLLSNATSPFFHTVMALSGTAGLFDHVVVSSEIGYAKPEPEIYRAILSDMKLSSSDALMIDDSQVNLDGAKKVGMPGHLYTSVQELRDFLLK
ncbi:HAD family phosphatase [Patescibacteria group bacterium]|nr:HAD family phosphatase [Patescibacteria group bacterium]MDE2173363.1 HAD family phosphatase [Patescibacteria group bacterium]